MRITKMRFTAALLCASALLAACGGDDGGGGGGNTDEVIDAMVESGMPQEGAECYVEALADEGVDLDDIAKMAEAADATELDPDAFDEDLMQAAVAASLKCADKMIEGLDIGDLDITVPETEG